MALTVFAQGLVGSIVVEDERDDGSIVLLVCEELEEPGPTGTVIQPDEEPKRGRIVWPKLKSLMQAARAPEEFELTVDISAMPGGAVLPFRSEQFLAHVRQLAGDDVTEASITPDNAGSWGFAG